MNSSGAHRSNGIPHLNSCYFVSQLRLPQALHRRKSLCRRGSLGITGSVHVPCQHRTGRVPVQHSSVSTCIATLQYHRRNQCSISGSFVGQQRSVSRERGEHGWRATSFSEVLVCIPPGWTTSRFICYCLCFVLVVVVVVAIVLVIVLVCVLALAVVIVLGVGVVVVVAEPNKILNKQEISTNTKK